MTVSYGLHQISIASFGFNLHFNTWAKQQKGANLLLAVMSNPMNIMVRLPLPAFSAFKLFETKMDKKLSELGSDFHKIVKNQMDY